MRHEYNFSHVLLDHVTDVEKKIESLQKAFVNDIRRMLGIMAFDLQQEKRDELLHSIRELFSVAKAKAIVASQTAANGIQEAINTYLD